MSINPRFCEKVSSEHSELAPSVLNTLLRTEAEVNTDSSVASASFAGLAIPAAEPLVAPPPAASTTCSATGQCAPAPADLIYCLG